MLKTDKSFAGSVPENYDRYMVPLIFEPYAADIARRAASLSPSAVLETAAGSGVVTRALAPKLSRSASYVVTDLNQPMIDHAASRKAPDSRIKWRQADALALPFENARSISSVASSARCSSPTVRLDTAKQGEFRSLEDVSYSTYGIASRRTSLLMV
jgi:ubiquinone/menaquinone biosynthesis C-methylase UbiE